MRITGVRLALNQDYVPPQYKPKEPPMDKKKAPPVVKESDWDKFVKWVKKWFAPVKNPNPYVKPPLQR